MGCFSATFTPQVVPLWIAPLRRDDDHAHLTVPYQPRRLAHRVGPLRRSLRFGGEARGTSRFLQQEGEVRRGGCWDSHACEGCLRIHEPKGATRLLLKRETGIHSGVGSLTPTGAVALERLPHRAPARPRTQSAALSVITLFFRAKAAASRSGAATGLLVLFWGGQTAVIGGVPGACRRRWRTALWSAMLQRSTDVERPRGRAAIRVPAPIAGYFFALLRCREDGGDYCGLFVDGLCQFCASCESSCSYLSCRAFMSLAGRPPLGCMYLPHLGEPPD